MNKKTSHLTPKTPDHAIRTRTAALTLKEVVSTLLPSGWISSDDTLDRTFFEWPPDSFAVAATVLRDSGAYLQVARPHDYEAKHGFSFPAWTDAVDLCAELWRSNVSGPHALPPLVTQILDEIQQQIREGVKLYELSRPSRSEMRWLPWTQLMCLADQTCRGMGLIHSLSRPIDGRKRREREQKLGYPHDSVVCGLGFDILSEQIKDAVTVENTSGLDAGPRFSPSTLCKLIDPTRAIVLPKMRTSQRGVTIRSLSLHLALFNGTDVEPLWIPTRTQVLGHTKATPPVVPNASTLLDPTNLRNSVGPYNIVVLPWPLKVRPAQFKPIPTPLSELGSRPQKQDGFFRFEHDEVSNDFATRIDKLLVEAEQQVGQVHGLVLPEMALSKASFDRAFGAGLPRNIEFLVCGVYEPATDGVLGRNYAIIRRKLMLESKEIFSTLHQEKHHRWALDGSQIATYSLGAMLRPDKIWWEGIDIPRRRLCFFALDGFTAFSVLICEDLARPDPVGDAVRAVGPNLVICLLMDGPQLPTRWSARYSTVLADDPGSSVLTVSSLGMVTASRPLDGLDRVDRTVGMWRQQGAGIVELRLPKEADAMVLTLSPKASTERTLDGREDSGMAGSLALSGVHWLKFEKATDR